MTSTPLEEHLAAKWFCGFTLSVPTADSSLIPRVRTRIGPTRLAQLFATMRDQLKAAGLMNGVFTFVDATRLMVKATLWEERDKARQQKVEKLNNGQPLPPFPPLAESHFSSVRPL